MKDIEKASDDLVEEVGCVREGGGGGGGGGGRGGWVRE